MTTNNVYLKLRPAVTGGHKGDGSIELIACDEKGELMSAGYLLTITPKGIILHASVNPKVGLPLGISGRLVVLK